MDEELQLKYLDSCYEELTTINDRSNVILVKHKDTGELRVKKLLNRYDKDLYERLSKTSIEGIPQVYEYVETNNGLIVVEEYINGKTLEEMLMMNGTFSESDVYHVFTCLADTLNRLHSMKPPIIHRDIKPSNLMITRDGALYLLDFNAAREYNTQSTKDTKLMGTQEYAAPEQYGFGQSDEKTDQYGLGVTINVLLTGELPRNHTTDGIYRQIILRLTQIDPSKRYKNMGEVIRELERFDRYFNKRSARKEKIVIPFHTYEGTWKRFLPVGFRSLKIWKMVLAVVMYTLILYACSSLVIDVFSPAKPWVLTVIKIICFLIFVFNVFYIGNYLGVRYRLPGVKINLLSHILLNFVYLLIMNFIMISCLIVFALIFTT